MTESVYPYSQGDRLNERNTYFYSEYRGPAFLDAWCASRNAALASLPGPLPLQLKAAMPQTTAYDAAQLLGELSSTRAEHALVDRLLQRFEVSKRIYRKYDQDLRAIRDSGYDDLDLYLLFAGLCLQSQQRPAPLRFLNALLKVLDTLIAAREQLCPEQAAQLAWLIGEERAWVQRIAAAAGLELTR
jgi:hypothetical protein